MPLNAETVDRLDALRSGFLGGAVVLQWILPEVDALKDKRILVAPGGVYWADVDNPSHERAGRKAAAVKDPLQLVQLIEQAGFEPGGEKLAQALLRQIEIDHQYRMRRGH